MWAELGLIDPDAVRHPPPLVHERVAQAIAGTAELARSVAARSRAVPGFDEATTDARNPDLPHAACDGVTPDTV
jgi:hypothetical protein